MTFTELSIADLEDPEALLLKSFFTPNDVSQAAGRAYLARLDRLEAEGDWPVTRAAAETQLVSIREWGQIPITDRYAMLKGIHQPTLIVHGTKDVVVDVANAVVLEENLADSILLMLPDAGHGAQSQYSDVFLANAKLFLGN